MYSSGPRGRRRTYLTIFKRELSANVKMVRYGMVCPLATSKAGARRPAIIQLEQLKEALSKPAQLKAFS
jgi:hypothetical protein